MVSRTNPPLNFDYFSCLSRSHTPGCTESSGLVGPAVVIHVVFTIIAKSEVFTFTGQKAQDKLELFKEGSAKRTPV